MKEKRAKDYAALKERGGTYLDLALWAFAGLGIEIILVVLIEPFLYGHGMLITHIDKSVPGWNFNCANCNSTLLGIDIEEANPQNKYNRPSNTFPGTSNVQSFTDNTNPGSLSNNYATLNKPIFRIKENNTTKNISFDFVIDFNTYHYLFLL